MWSTNHVQTIDSRLKSRIYGHGRGAVFTPNDFLDLGGRDAVDKALSRLTARGVIRRLARGLYEYPREHPELGTLLPDLEKVAKALAGKHRIRLQPAGAYAANLLGLSEQVPAKIVFLTDGPSRTVKIGRQEIHLRRTTPRNMAAAGRLSGLLMQAFRSLGRQHITRQRLARLKLTLPAKERKQLIKDLPLAPTWMHPFFRELAES
jgi:predicted transcriptional regulator of viral defense system